jgi:transcription initiation protein SPT3
MAASEGRSLSRHPAKIVMPNICHNPDGSVQASMLPLLAANEEYRNERIEGYKRIILIPIIEQMMFVAGETGEPSSETTTLIEQIVHEQVYEMVNYSNIATTTANLKQLKKSTETATRRGSRTITHADLFFLIRHDKAKTARLKTFLSWKDVRKTARDSDDKGADAADAADDALGGGDGAGGPTAPIGDVTKRSKKKIKLPWDISSYFSEQLPEGEDEDDEEEEEANIATLERLQQADKRTKGMTKDEYVHYSECRQASFTYKKAKRFREWAGFGIVTDSKPNDDIVDILGFLLYDIVQTLTEEALLVKAEEDRYKTRHGGSDAQNKKRKKQTGLFDPPEEGTTPVTPKHVREAFRRLQEKPIPGRCTVWMGPQGMKKTELKLVRENSFLQVKEISLM